ncbi:MAG: hypothetical protein AAGF31_11830, partial [Planctomycetota bacterium]
MSRTLQSKQTERIRERRRQLRQRRQRDSRRGVLLLVVLSMLVLFLLVGTTFVVTTASYRTGSKAVERSNETSLQAGDRLERALLQVLRDTNNPHSAIRFHSLLRDTYGTDGFVGHVFAGIPRNINDLSRGFAAPTFRSNPATSNRDPSSRAPLEFPDFISRYADATNNNLLGPTNGQFIDIYVNDDLGVDVSDNQVGLSSEYVVDLELNQSGLTTNHRLSRVGGYYNGCLLTILEGPAKGQTARIVQYDFIVDPNVASPDPRERGIARFRVLAFPRNDGQPLQLGTNPQLGDSNDLLRVEDTATNFGEIADNDSFFGVRFMVNGRPNNGAGVGFNPFAGIADPKLSALEIFADADPMLPQFAPVALLPNARYMANEIFLRDFDPTIPGQREQFRFDYGIYPGRGGSDESYDAADFQNMFLALQSLTPRASARITSQNLLSSNIPSIELFDSRTQGVCNNDVGVRFLTDDVPIPSFHRPSLVNYWFYRILNAPWLTATISDPNVRMRAVVEPYDVNGNPQFGLSAAQAGQIATIKRKIMLRPTREDHPNFDGSNPDSRYRNRIGVNNVGRLVDDANGEIIFPTWETTGPWDVDNDNDGVPDSVWVDLGDPVQRTSDGRLYKPLYAILIEDMDGRLNLNDHGSKDHLAGADLDGSTDGNGIENFNLATGASSILGISGSSLFSSNQLPHGTGWGPGDITLRPVMSPDMILNNQTRIGDPTYDDYARLLFGRRVPEGFTTTPNTSLAPLVSETSFGRYGSVELYLAAGGGSRPGSGINFSDGLIESRQTTDPLSAFELYDFPSFDRNTASKGVEDLAWIDGTIVNDVNPAPVTAAARRQASLVSLGGALPSGFATTPDLLGRYAAPGLSYGGTPLPESAVDRGVPALVADSPYELNVMENARRGPPQATSLTQNDDAPFSAAELERVLRAYDA